MSKVSVFTFLFAVGSVAVLGAKAAGSVSMGTYVSLFHSLVSFGARDSVWLHEGYFWSEKVLTTVIPYFLPASMVPQ